MKTRLRILIAGGPRVGKTTFAARLAAELGPDVPIRHTDSLIGRLAWSDASARVSEWLEQPGPWVIEGVTVVRALRKYLARHASGAPADLLYVSEEAKCTRTTMQLAMGKSFTTIWTEISDELRLRGLVPQLF